MSSSPPYLKFEVTSKTLIIETNEDGFRRKNIDAICTTRRSSKKTCASDDHIGEKGIGFKSVFAVAKEARIQSGLWSFCFKHKKGENGLGMVTPLESAAEKLPNGVTTRITLRYTKEVRQDYQRFLKAIKELPDTIPLFLRKLRKIEITVFDQDDQHYRSLQKKYSRKPSKCTIERTTKIGGCRSSKTLEFLLFNGEPRNLPEEELRLGSTKSTVQLAFPIDSETQPILSDHGQQVCAFLPLQRLPQLQVITVDLFIRRD